VGSLTWDFERKLNYHVIGCRRFWRRVSLSLDASLETFVGRGEVRLLGNLKDSGKRAPVTIYYKLQNT
jgi:hypothetical protein